ncbi:MAG TPA: dihydroorotate dehydrogenase, partial [Vicinamibacteria bacterium]
MQLGVDLFGVRFKNPVLLAAGTCGFGEEVSQVLRLDRLGGLVTKSVTLEPRRGNPAPRVAEFSAGMVNSVGLANPGAHAVRDHKLPWIRANLPDVPVVVSVAGHSVQEYFEVVEILEGQEGFVAFELNLSCPNDRMRDGLPFALDPDALYEVTRGVLERTARPVVAKLAPNTWDLAAVIQAAESSGANGLTMINTMPGLVLDPETGRPALGAGEGGVSGPALRAVGLRAVSLAARLTRLPILGVGGIGTAEHAAAYLRAGASLVQVGTASFWHPRAAERVVKGLERLGRTLGIRSVRELSPAHPVLDRAKDPASMPEAGQPAV